MDAPRVVEVAAEVVEKEDCTPCCLFLTARAWAWLACIRIRFWRALNDNLLDDNISSTDIFRCAALLRLLLPLLLVFLERALRAGLAGNAMLRPLLPLPLVVVVRRAEALMEDWLWVLVMDVVRCSAIEDDGASDFWV